MTNNIIHIVMCSWKRIHNIDKIINSLNNQTVSNRIYFHILNNNKNFIDILNKKINKFKNQNNSPTKLSIKLFLKHYDNKYFGFQRFFYVKNVLLNDYLLKYVIFIDDDQYFNNTYIENLYKMARPKTYISYYCKKFNLLTPKYWIRSNNKNGLFDYGGTGGSIIDVSIFNNNSKIWNIPDNLPNGVNIYNIEDLWLSYITRSYYNYKIKRSFLIPMSINDEKTKNLALWYTLKKEKQLFLEYLVNTLNWKLIPNKKIISCNKSSQIKKVYIENCKKKCFNGIYNQVNKNLYKKDNNHHLYKSNNTWILGTYGGNPYQKLEYCENKDWTIKKLLLK